MTNPLLFVFGLWLVGATAGLAATITIDFNGFPFTVGGQVTGPGLDNPISMPPFAKTAVLDDLQAGPTYRVDFFHDDTSDGASDFDFVVAADGKGVASVALGDGAYQGLDGFKPGDRMLKLKTFAITVNANSGQTGPYYIPGLTEALPPDSGPQKFTVIPGHYRVDNLSNTAGGLEDYKFVINGDGQLAPGGPLIPGIVLPPVGSPAVLAFTDSREFAEFTGTEIRPRSVRVRFKVEMAGPMQYNPSQPVTNVVVDGTVVELDMLMPVGGGGLNVWAFGTNTVNGGTVVKPDGQPDVGTRRENDYLFNPLLGYDRTKQQFYFVTTRGPSQTVTGETKGLADDGVTPLQAKVTATITAPPPSR
ncbi:hypothetical protein HQ590_05725 [bacterium]|nr:hypothetical protein [bacterium]